MEITETFDEISCSDSMNRLDSGIASCCSQNSSRTEQGVTNNFKGSSTACLNGDGTNGVELVSRIKSLGRENVYLKEELSHAEEKILSLERNVKLASTALDQVTNKYLRLQKENEEQNELITQAEQRDESSKLSLRKLERSHLALQKKVEKLEGQKDCNLKLTAEKEKIVKRNLEYTKQITQLKSKLAEKCIENENFREKNNELQRSITKLDESHQKSLQYYENKIHELQNLVAELQSKLDNRDNDCECPSSLLHFVNHSKPVTHSTPYVGNQKTPHRNSLFSELRDSWIDFHDFRNEDHNIFESKTDVCKMPDILPIHYNIEDDWKVDEINNDLINSARFSKDPRENESLNQMNNSTYPQSSAVESQFSNSYLENSQSTIDMKYVTIRENTYTQESNAFTELSTNTDSERECSSQASNRADTPNLTAQRSLLQDTEDSSRKSLFCEKCFDVANQQMPEKGLDTNRQLKYGSISMPIVQNSDTSTRDYGTRRGSIQALDTCVSSSTSLQFANDSMVSSSSPSVKNLGSPNLDNANAEEKPSITVESSSIAPTELNRPYTNLNQMSTSNTAGSEATPFAPKVLEKPLWFGTGIGQLTILDSLQPRTKRDEARKSLFSYRSRRKSVAVDNIRFRHENSIPD